MHRQVDIQKLLRAMTIEEKAGQLLQLATFFYLSETEGEITGPLSDLGIAEDEVWRSGSVLGINNAEEMIAIQKKYLENSKHKIPLLFMADIVHGYRTIFPIPLAIGCSWNLEGAKKSAQVAAKEAALSGVHVTFSPMVDLVRDPRWGRVMEATGEDPYLNSAFAKAFVEGYQGDMTGEYDIAACVKHFAGYGAAEAGREYNTVDMSDRTLREYYLPAYKAALDAGCRMVMTSFNTVHGVPATGNKYLMREILRDEWGFDGVVISDWGAVGELLQHGVAKDSKDVAQKAIEASVDIEMMTSHYVQSLKKLVEDGTVSETLIDESVLRILKLKQELGLFENPYKVANLQKAQEAFLCEEHREAAREIATKSMVLLKNEGILPLDKNKKIAIVGPLADSGDILGAWAWQGKPEEAITLKQGIECKVGAQNISVAMGCTIDGIETEGFKEAIKIAQEADVVILALGEKSSMCGEAASRAFIKLPGIQEEFAKTILALEKPTVTVLLNGRPLEITELSTLTPALLEAWFPGTEGGNAIADILFGDSIPSGRLSMSFPYTVGQIPVYYNCYNTGRPQPNEDAEGYFSRYLDIPNAPLYPFGYGLSYTEFNYDNFTLSQEVLHEGETIKASVCIKNVGNRVGTETVQFYIKDEVGSTVRPLKELKGFRQVTLQPQEEKTVTFEITEEMLKYHNIKSDYVAEKGSFIAMVGKNAVEVLSLNFELA
ncbi:MAG: glycoside hydrolase family 3 N-terminal domain-containing protein [Cellulosilyticaceae bacterium]